MKKIAALTGMLMVCAIGLAQVTEGEKQLRDVKIDGSKGWKVENNLTVSFSQVSLTNWVAGGQNSMTINGRFNGFYNYKKEKLAWDNQVDLGYGLLKQGKTVWQKSDDRFEIMSKLGYQLKENMNAAVLANFKSQFADGRDKPVAGKLISAAFAPAYFLGAAGLDLKKGENFTLFLSPVTTKMTFVLNEVLSEAGAYGVAPGEKFRAELGGYLRVMAKHNLFQNVSLQTKLDLFSNYLKDPQFVDVNWEVFVLMKVNKFLSVNLNTLLIYDHDILIGKTMENDGVDEAPKPRVQFKEIFGLGLSFNLK